MEVIERYQIDLTDPLKFPNFKRRWQSFVESLANEGLKKQTSDSISTSLFRPLSDNSLRRDFGGNCPQTLQPLQQPQRRVELKRE